MQINKILKVLSIFIICIITLSVFIKYRDKGSAAHHLSQKQQRWQEMEKEVNSWTDALGLKIDPGIKKTVVVLNLLGFKTEQSCEGHIDWGRLYPWVSITTEDEEMKALLDEGIKISNEIQAKEANIQKKYPNIPLREALSKESTQELEEMYRKRLTTFDTINKISRLKVLPLNNLIANFYATHPINPDRMIILQEFGFETCDMFSLGGNWQVVRDENEKREKLKEYQQEMGSFADFLTNYYFTN